MSPRAVRRSTRSTVVAPSAARLAVSLRDIGYDTTTAIADVVDNAVSAGANQVSVSTMVDAKAGPLVVISDDGEGMGHAAVLEALRFGSARSYAPGDLGRYGLGLKTASLSQARTVTLASRRKDSASISVARLGLDAICEADDWVVTELPDAAGADPVVDLARFRLGNGESTVVVWSDLDRMLPPSRASEAWAKRRLEAAAEKLGRHLSMVFSRLMSGPRGLRVRVNGTDLVAWDPFCANEPATVEMDPQTFQIPTGVGSGVGTVTLRRFVLPARDRFSTPAAFEEAGGPRRWNRQQGLHVYRADRLVSWGGWAGIRAVDEHTKLARASLSFDTDLDEEFNVDVAKMKVSVPATLRAGLERGVADLCAAADAAYRSAASTTPKPGTTASAPFAGGDLSGAGLGLLSAAVQSGHHDALREIVAVWRADSPELVAALGLDAL